jgi:hypothetical protein
MPTLNRQENRPDPRPTEGLWWRFSSYEIERGCIRPTAGAKLEWYDPWRGFGETRKLTIGQSPGASQPNYQSLLKLVRALEYRSGARRYPDCLAESSQTRILEWCSEHGLLGVLLTRWQSIRLAAQRHEEGLDRQFIYARGPGQTIETRVIVGDIEQPAASVTLRELNGYQLFEEPPNTTWRWFFPAINPKDGDRHQYPKPYTEEFCRIYGERLSFFCKAAKLLTDAIRHLDRKPRAGTGPDLAREQALRAINWLRAPVGSVLDCDEAIQSRRVSSSLIASYADMYAYAQDLAYGLAQFPRHSCCTPSFPRRTNPVTANPLAV